MNEQRVPKSLLRRECEKIFTAAGVKPTDAANVADVLITTDMRGIHSHGVIRSARYIDCIQSGGIRPDVKAEVLTETPATAQVSAVGGLGIPAAVMATRLVIEKARRNGVAVVTVNHSDHYGAAGIYAMCCADAGLIGFSMSNTCPLIAPAGGAKAAIGNNPFSYAAPGRKYRGLLFDICMSVVASGKLILASADGRKIPFGWILDKDGKPTDDPAEIYKGAIMLPFAAHKGYGLAMMVEMLTGCLGNSGITEDVNSWNTIPGRDADTGHCFMAIDPECFGGLEAFQKRVDLLIDRMVATPPAEGFNKVFYPGEIEFEREGDALQNGVPLPEASLAELRRAAKLVNVELNFEK